jgi:hypothetical protein
MIKDYYKAGVPKPPVFISGFHALYIRAEYRLSTIIPRAYIAFISNSNNQ